MSSTRTIIAITAGTTLALGIGYVLYFDYKRRNDADFRRQLRHGQKQIEKQRAREARVKQEASKNDYKKAWLELKEEPIPNPERPSEVERFFMTNLSEGEKLVANGPPYLAAAKKFYTAYRVFPDRANLLEIFEKSLPDEVVEIIKGIRDAADADANANADAQD